MSDTNIAMEMDRETESKIAYAFWRQSYVEANANLEESDYKDAWMKVRDNQIKITRRAIVALKKNGFNISKTET
ncbi:hypothetical protein [Roseibium sp.]|uniref:hypothetical protein n=1 Tax=Roseibium sp. TaxID=1936156 RepID=UPI003BAD4087